MSSPAPGQIQNFKDWINQDSEEGSLIARNDDFLDDRIPEAAESRKYIIDMPFQDDDATDLATLRKKKDSLMEKFTCHNYLLANLTRVSVLSSSHYFLDKLVES